MILAHTSVWIDYFRSSNSHFSDLLENDRIICHELVIGELACGNLKNRKEILRLLNNLRNIEPASFHETLYFIEENKLMGKGLGWVDVSLLASTIINDCILWTMDKRLSSAAKKLKVNYKYVQ
ncbi:MAG: PIN domain-containing protein [Candidatus Dadabacteria bacterium]|nr:PIN domain-containing protein [Candidatus Dadabacteria bacterium]NIS07384.1 PIN domain-containing protein [Candidatus Dadabacteria bacterium]NIV41343.1 PIN domain-containing protein [Candidatus Dadabacteria bacterium]NIX14554.1 PIN domain-containing protein [Candidatus Dadabacteria bacterium]NIY21021.1 PIN domain-containing protein [Candidatus Dadabacteria bacterium]